MSRRDMSTSEVMLTHSALLEENAAVRSLRAVIFIISVVVLLFFVWAGVAPVSKIVRAEEEVATTVPLQRVQHLEGGIVAEIRVRDGQRVAAGDVLVRLDTRSLEAEKAQIAVRAANLLLDVERLEALLEEREPRFATVLPDGLRAAVGSGEAALLRAQAALHEGERSAQLSRVNLLNARISAAQAEIRNQESLRAEALRRRQLLDEEQEMRATLARSGSQTRLQMIEMSLRLSSAESSLREVDVEIERQRRVIEEASLALVDHRDATRADRLARRAAALREAGELAEAIARIDERLSRAVVTEPISGTVLIAFLETVGGVISPGADIARIVPAEAGLRIVARVAPADIAAVREGDQDRIRLPAFDEARLPAIMGRIDSVSPDILVDQRGRVHYRAFVSFDPEGVRAATGSPPRPGMAAELGILVGDRTLLEYFFRLLELLIGRLFTER